MPVQIDTFVFMDLETTDLIRGSKMPEITELALVAVSRRFLEPDDDPMFLPRIMHKLTIPVCPLEQSVSSRAERVTNLSDDSLHDARPFDDDTCKLIKQFLRRLPGIICFVAHNGNRFDYRIFLAELDNVNEHFPKRLRCVDALEAFHEYFDDKSDQPSNYKLSTIHEYLTGEEPCNLHCAEDDCLSLLRCVRRMDEFANWADFNATRLCEL